jgi:hypothetical protein
LQVLRQTFQRRAAAVSISPRVVDIARHFRRQLRQHGAHFLGDAPMIGIVIV